MPVPGSIPPNNVNTVVPRTLGAALLQKVGAEKPSARGETVGRIDQMTRALAESKACRPLPVAQNNTPSPSTHDL
ncbi:hypothetical protein JMUB6875_15420 [Nocardia sp. JMUB6875]